MFLSFALVPQCFYPRKAVALKNSTLCKTDKFLKVLHTPGGPKRDNLSSLTASFNIILSTLQSDHTASIPSSIAILRAYFASNVDTICDACPVWSPIARTVNIIHVRYVSTLKRAGQKVVTDGCTEVH